MINKLDSLHTVSDDNKLLHIFNWLNWGRVSIRQASQFELKVPRNTLVSIIFNMKKGSLGWLLGNWSFCLAHSTIITVLLCTINHCILLFILWPFGTFFIKWAKNWRTLESPFPTDSTDGIKMEKQPTGHHGWNEDAFWSELVWKYKRVFRPRSGFPTKMLNISVLI